MKLSTLKYVVGAVLAAAILGGGAWAITANQNKSPAAVSHQTVLVDRHRTEITYTATAGVTALEQLKAEADNVVIKDSDYGPYVDSIEGHAGGTGGKYWSFYVDGAMAAVGADAYVQHGGEEITWKFQKL